MKFKEGDRVVQARDSVGYNITQIGNAGEVMSIGVGYLYVKFDLYNDNLDVLEKDLELESIYNSPLYKALL